MPTLSNGSELTVWEDTNNESPDAILFTIKEADGDTLGPVGAQQDYFFGWVDLASVDVFDGFFTVTTFTNDGRTEVFSRVETHVFDNDGNYIRTLSAQAAYLSTDIVSVTAESPDDITVTWVGANEYLGGENTQYGEHEIILEDGVLQPDTFVNNDPTVANLTFTLSPGQSLDDIKFSAADADFDLLSFIVADGPDHGTLEQETRYDAGYYPFPQGEYAGSLHYHQDFLSGNYFDYSPESGFTGTDSFTVYATDGQGNSNLATIIIKVVPPPESIVLTEAREIVSYAAYDHAVLVAANGGNDRITGSGFDDTLDGGQGNDRLRGGAGDDDIFGGAGSDCVHGGDGNDILSGGASRDTLTGGAGNDTFVFDAAPGLAQYDRISDFRSVDDVVRLDSSIFVGLAAGALDADAFVIGRAATDEDHRIVYDQASGALSFDADGVGGAAAVRFAMLGRGTSLSADDFMIA
ncbi:Ig-like domain-containing protein [Pararhizobium sp. BT-229]|uniref:Ig-like domain-containing protein n=1 Tax=Pararhizobium sp. BT-229 TaxID=2986923 RepID=UPI0021F796D6|nr:Ig-like domain-containing protein [Pararhizobium sp. BT-229]MCV9967086.1 Ig-like domain-containing protein [Pararhizobium sp. BT-229]